MARELADLRQRVSTPTLTKNKTDIIKLDVSACNGEGDGFLHLNRWFCEVDIAVEARQLSTELARTPFLLSKLTGKAKEWALGKLVVDASCFPTMEAMKADLRLAVEPPQDETVQRSAFLSLKQGCMSMLEYISRARHLISCITTFPVEMATQVHVFVSGMNAGCNGDTRKRLHVATWLHRGFSSVGVRHTNGYTLQTAGLYAFRLPIGR
ncbi:hypothetical protein PI125_g23328 [Phytophthora idaei]|nr:hypothetical protein PI125_g23328 [Phytophthora idaei]